MNKFTIFCNSLKVINRLKELGFSPKKNGKGNTFEIATRESPQNWCQAAFKNTEIVHHYDYYLINFCW